MTGAFVIEPLAARHDRDSFACGVDALDRYLKTQATQDMRRNISNCFVAVPEAANRIAGYFTLAAASVPVAEIPAELAKRLPRYPVLPAVVIGRLAIDRAFTRRALGSALLYDAIARTRRADPAVYAVIVDAKDDGAATFYRRFGFQPFANRELSLFLPMATAARLIEQD